MRTASRREHDFRITYLETENDVERQCARGRDESSVSEKYYFLMNLKCAQRRGESTIFEKPSLRRKMTLHENVHGVEARARFLKSGIFRGTNMCTASRREHDF